MIIIFGRRNSVTSLLVRLWTWSTWSHVGIVHGNYVIESDIRYGVVKTPLDKFKRKYNKYEFAEIQGDSSEAFNYIGVKYDWSAIFGIALRTGWNNTDKLVCSELIGVISGLFRKDRSGRVTPEDIYKVSKTKIY